MNDPANAENDFSKAALLAGMTGILVLAFGLKTMVVNNPAAIEKSRKTEWAIAQKNISFDPSTNEKRSFFNAVMRGDCEEVGRLQGADRKILCNDIKAELNF